MELPNIYPYIINNPSEGTQTKRRSYSCLIDHLIPVMTNAGIHEALQDVDLKVQEYLQVEAMNPKALPVARQQLWEMVHKANLDQDLQISRDQAMADFDGFMEKLHGYLSEVADTYIAHGLHTLGQAPQGEGLVELATQLLRLRIGDTPSLRESVASHWGLDYDQMLANRGAKCGHQKFATNAQAIEAVHEKCLDLVRRRINGQEIPGEEVSPQIEQVLDFLTAQVLPRLEKTSDEMESIVRSLAGEYIPPGGSGNPTRGQLDILPTGRNFFTVDPEKVPSRSAWETGVAMAEKLQERYQEETGGPVDTMGMVIWCINTMRNQGEDVAQALYMMGIEPVWDPNNGKVIGLEVMPLEKMENPRVDITFRTSGCFRDTFPNVAELLDRAVTMAAALQEPHGRNFLRRNVQREVEELAKQGLSPEDAFREASFRVFSCQPGTYGAGVCTAIDAKAWQTSDDLGEVYVNWGGFAYGQGVYGADKKDTFRRRLKDIKLIVKNEDSREYDLFSSDDFNSYFGGFIAAVKMESGVQPMAYAGDASDPDRVKYRSVQEEVKHIFRSRILNPKWIESMRAHGFKGAGDLSRNVDLAFHWDATSEVIDDWMYQELADRLAFNQAMQDWFKEVNPYALHNIAERLLEAINRDMWNTDPETRQKLEELFLETEGDIEDSTG
jgi:cobaltochelatase CobN